MATTCSLFEIDADLNKLVEAYPQFSLLPEIDRTIFRASKGRVSQLSLVLACHRAIEAPSLRRGIPCQIKPTPIIESFRLGHRPSPRICDMNSMKPVVDYAASRFTFVSP
jgi:hypothetical protein